MREENTSKDRTQAPGRLLWTAEQAARSLSISPRSLWSLTRPRGDLPAVRIGRRVLYDPRDSARLIDQRKEVQDGPQ